MGFPFTFFRHGEVNLDSKLKNAEAYVVFAREVAASERKWIQERCPSPIAGMFDWSGRFAYFGSGGDTFDFDVLSEFGGKAVAKLIEGEDWEGALEHMGDAMKAFVASHDAWLEGVHAKVPIAFAEAATSTEEDAWGEWSSARVDEAIATLKAIRPTLAKRPDEMERFRWIEARVLGLLGSAPADTTRVDSRVAAVAEQLASLEISVPIERLSYGENELHTAGEALGRALGGSKGAARKAMIAKLPPRARLAYYASYAALDNGDLLALKDVAGALDDVAGELSRDEQWRAASLLAFTAANLAHLTPGFSKPSAKHAKAAMALFERAIARGARDARTFYDAIRCAKLVKNKSKLVAIANEGIDATRDPDVAKEASKIAKALGDAKSSKAFAARAKSILVSSQIAQTKPAADLAKHLASGGEPTVDLLGNLAVRWGNDPKADKRAVEALIARLGETMLREPAFGMNRAVALNFGVLAGNHGFGDRAIDVLDALVGRGLSLADQIGLTFSYAATISTDDARRRRVLARFASADRSQTSPLTFENLAEVWMALGDYDGAIAAIASARDRGHPHFAKLRDEKSFEPLRGKPAFDALFERRSSKTK